jgi:hypothetical protein
VFELTVRADDISQHGGHIKIKVLDLDSKESCVISFSGFTGPVTRGTNWNENEKCGCCHLAYNPEDDYTHTNAYIGPYRVSLYSDADVSFSQFQEDIKNKFPKFHGCFSNCADAANFTLNYFFPLEENLLEEIIMQAYKLATFPITIALCCGTMQPASLFGSPPGMNSPADVMKKAKLLSLSYGKHSNLFSQYKNEHQPVNDEKMEMAPKRQMMT